MDIITILIIGWLLIGIITAWRTYYGFLKLFDDLSKMEQKNKKSQLHKMISYLPFIAISGVLSFVVFEVIHRGKNVWYYNPSTDDTLE